MAKQRSERQARSQAVKRKAIPLKVKLAAALLTIMRPDEFDNVLVPVIPHTEAKTLTADQIISRFEFDHFPISKWLDGPDEPWNLVPRPKKEHRQKTAKVDVPAAAKSKRIRKQEDEFRRRMLEPDLCAKADRPGKKAVRWSSLPKKYKRKLSGEVVLRCSK